MIRMIMGVLIFATLAIIMGCATTMPGGGNVTPGALVNATTVPGSLSNYDQRYAAYPDSFNLMGQVEGHSGNVNVLGIISVGNGGFIGAFENALSSSGAEGIINANGDIHAFGILGLFSSSRTTVKGIGIKLKSK
jgi:hypothetical protein